MLAKRRASGAEIKRFYSTGRLPLAALVIAPNRLAEINSFKDMEECTVGIVSRGSIYEGLTLFLMTRSGKPPAGAARQRLGRGAFSASDGAYGFRQPPRPYSRRRLGPSSPFRRRRCR
jgi:hypothetical protein